MSERSRRAGRNTWRAKERKLRAKYRGKIAVAVIISLIVGMIGGIVVDKLVLTKHADTTVTPVATATATADTSEGGLANLFGNPTEAVETEAPATQPPVEETAEPEITAEPVVTKSADEVFPEEETEPDETAAEVKWEEEPETVEAAPTLAIGLASANAQTESAVEETDSGDDNFSSIIAGLNATESETGSDQQSVEEPVEEPVQESTEAPTEEPAQESTEAPTEEPAQESTEAPTEEPAQESTEEPSEEPVQESTEESVEEPVQESTEEPAEESVQESTEAPTEAPTPEPTPAPDQPEIVPYGTAYKLTTDINSDGTAHTVNDGSDFENVSLTLQVKKYLDFDYYDRTYGSKYNLKGGTAAVVLEMTLNEYTGTTPIVPQNFLLITFCDETGGVTTQGVQLIDAEIAGNTSVTITSDVPATIYKRYFKEDAGKEMTYMVVTTYNNGVKKEYRFEIIIPPEMITPEPTADPNMVGLSVGSRGDDVQKLQEALIEAGYLSGTADGIYGTNTAEAVKLMQKQFGLEETGDAGPLFLTYLYMDTE